jgi:hypothetical protein
MGSEKWLTLQCAKAATVNSKNYAIVLHAQKLIQNTNHISLLNQLTKVLVNVITFGTMKMTRLVTAYLLQTFGSMCFAILDPKFCVLYNFIVMFVVIDAGIKLNKKGNF